MNSENLLEQFNKHCLNLNIEDCGKCMECALRFGYNKAIKDFERCLIQQSEYMETEEGWCGMVADTKTINEIAEQLKKGTEVR